MTVSDGKDNRQGSAKTSMEPISADDVEAIHGTVYPPEFAHVVQGRSKAKLGDVFGLSNFGVNYTNLEPGASSALLHHHATQDEMVYVLEGEVTLTRLYDETTHKTTMRAGDCVGFPAGLAVAHCMRNESAETARFLEIGDRSPGDRVEYPNNDLKAVMQKDGLWKFVHKDGRPYDEDSSKK